MKLSRRALLATGAAALLPTACRDHAAANAGSFAFDQTRFREILSRPARHRQCFGSARVAKGIVITSIMASMYAYETSLREGPGALHAVAVLYHPEGVMLGFGDVVWDQLLAPAAPKIEGLIDGDLTDFNGQRPRSGQGNPYLRRNANKALDADISLEALAERGCDFFLCNDALNGVAAMLGDALQRPKKEVYALISRHLIPNSMVVPAGVMAINACQEAHFTYVQSAL